MRYPDDFIDRVRSALTLREVAEHSETVAGGRAPYDSTCPFHDEKTPSMKLWEDHFKCFGCGESGDLFTWIMRVEGLSFVGAVEHAAGLAGVALPERREPTPEEQKRTSEREAILDALAAAAEFFRARLLEETDEAGHALGELARRELDAVAPAFGAGLAPKAGGLMQALVAQGHSKEAILAADLVKERDDGSGIYERFRNRFVFPLRDARGRVVGFTGRTLDPEPSAKVAKWLNSSETAVFRKRELFFGLDVARGAIAKSRRVVVVEGPGDCAAMHAKGFANVVAVNGTSLSAEHLTQLKRLCDEVVILFDGDDAGRKGAERALSLFLEFKLPARVAELPEGQDPDTAVRSKERELGTHGVGDALDASPPLFDWWVERTLEACNSEALRLRALEDELVPMLARLEDFSRELYVDKAAELWKVKKSTLSKFVAARAAKDDERRRAAEDRERAKEADETDAPMPYPGMIVETQQGMAILRKKRDSDQTYPHTIFSALIEVKSRVRIKHEGEFFSCVMRDLERKVEVEVMLPPTAWLGRKEFISSLPTNDFALTASLDEMEKLKRHLAGGEASIFNGVRALGIHPAPETEEGEWCAVLSDVTYLQGGGTSQKVIRYEEKDSGVAWRVGERKPPTPQELRKFADAAPFFIELSQSGGMWGWVFTLPVKARLRRLNSKRFPFFFLWGEAGGGKSAALDLMMTFYSGNQSNRYGAKSFTNFTAVFIPTTTTGPVPMVIDEFKPADMDRIQKSRVSEILHHSYDGVAAARGERSGKSVMTHTPTAPLIVTGEDLVSTFSSVDERMVEVFLRKRYHQETDPHYKVLTELDLERIGLDYTIWTLGLKDKELKRLYEESYSCLNDRFTGRIRENVAVAHLGLTLFRRYLDDRAVSWMPDAEFESFTKEMEAGQLSARYPSTEGGKNRTTVDKVLESMSAMAANNELRIDQDFLLSDWTRTAPDGDPESEPELLYIYLHRVWPRWSEWIRKTDWEGEKISAPMAFRKLLAGEEYFKGNKGKRFPGLTYTTHPQNVIVLDYRLMIKMGLDMSGFKQNSQMKSY